MWQHAGIITRYAGLAKSVIAHIAFRAKPTGPAINEIPLVRPALKYYGQSVSEKLIGNTVRYNECEFVRRKSSSPNGSLRRKDQLLFLSRDTRAVRGVLPNKFP
jgi:hypothetical protein